MERSIKRIVKEAIELVWKDIKNIKIAVCLIVVYFWMNRSLFSCSCMWVAITGFPCPGCGLTRAGLDLLKGNFKDAFRIHPFIYVIVLLGIWFCIYRYILKKSQKVFVKYAIVVLLAMIGFYVYRMIAVFPSEPPMSYYKYNLINTFLYESV